MKRICPACSHDLRPGEKYGVLQFACASCRGAWFLAGRLAQLAGQNLPVMGATRPSARLCPDCHGLMQLAPLGSVEVDWCDACEGIFVDRGEIAAIRAEADAPAETAALLRWVHLARIIAGLG